MSLCGLGISCEPLPCKHGKQKRNEHCHFCELEMKVDNLGKTFTEILNDHIGRINKLESMTDFKDIEACIFEGAKTHASILKCERKIDELEKYKSLIDSLNNNRNDWINGDNEIMKEMRQLQDNHANIINDCINRINKLEGHYYSDGDLSAIHGQIDNIHNNNKHYDHQIDRLEKLYIASTEMESHLLNRIKDLEKIIKELERFQEITNIQYRIRKRPYKCPICNGEIKIFINPECLCQALRQCLINVMEMACIIRIA